MPASPSRNRRRGRHDGQGPPRRHCRARQLTKRPGNSPVKELSPWLREAAIGGFANEIMREVIGRLADRMHESSPLQLTKGGEKFSDFVTAEAREAVECDAAAVRCRQDKQVTRPL